jgi:hypothetical protein
VNRTTSILIPTSAMLLAIGSASQAQQADMTFLSPASVPAKVQISAG